MKCDPVKGPLPDHFTSTSHGPDWHLYCRKCGRGWSLPKSNDRPGNLLHLLNHARSHDAKRK